MICFLTSSIDDPETGKMNPANRFIEELRLRFPRHCRALYICSDPGDPDRTDLYASVTRQLFEGAGFAFESFSTLDGRNEGLAPALVREADLLVLTGGHVPTQNRFFGRIGLRGLLQGHTGILMGISAGSMNAADQVYAQPEEEGEASDPSYKRFLPGLGLTRTCLLPHYQKNKDDTVDGLRIYADIACPDSMGRTFYAVPDGTYLYIDGRREELRGEAFRIRDGIMTQVSRRGDVLSL